jgi:paraquat-inducible protein B
MKHRRVNPVKIGVFVIGGAAILVAGVLFIGSGRFFRRTHSFVSYFDGSVDGLRAGASVKFKGVELGRVERVRIPFGIARTDQPIAVFFRIDDAQLDDESDTSGSWMTMMQGAIRNGMRAQLESDSLVTGVQHVSLTFNSEAKPITHAPIDGYMEIPTIPPPLQEVGAAIRTIVDRIGRYDFEKLLDSVRNTLDATTELMRGPELHAMLASLDGTLKEVQQTVAKLGAHVDPLSKQLETLVQHVDALGTELQSGVGTAKTALASVQSLADGVAQNVQPLSLSLKQTSEALQAMAHQIESTLSGTRVLLDPEAPIAVELRKGLRELSETARATRALFELLERNPSALVRGRGEMEGEPR